MLHWHARLNKLPTLLDYTSAWTCLLATCKKRHAHLAESSAPPYVQSVATVANDSCRRCLATVWKGAGRSLAIALLCRLLLLLPLLPAAWSDLCVAVPVLCV